VDLSSLELTFTFLKKLETTVFVIFIVLSHMIFHNYNCLYPLFFLNMMASTDFVGYRWLQHLHTDKAFPMLPILFRMTGHD
jgi:hypothetical protein